MQIPQYYTIAEVKKMYWTYRHLWPKLKIRRHNTEENKFYITVLDNDQEVILAVYKKKHGLPFDFNALHDTRTD